MGNNFGGQELLDDLFRPPAMPDAFAHRDQGNRSYFRLSQNTRRRQSPPARYHPLQPYLEGFLDRLRVDAEILASGLGVHTRRGFYMFISPYHIAPPDIQ